MPDPGALLLLRFPDFFHFSKKAYRYNPAGYSALYVGEKESTVAGEVKQSPGLAGFDASPAQPDVVYHVEISVTALLDVTTPDVQTILGTTPAELLAPWMLLTPHAPTQVLGKAVHAFGEFEGIRYQSAAMAKVSLTVYCVVLFEDRLKPSSRVGVFDPSGTFAQQLWPRP